MYKKDQFWEFISTTGNPDYIPILSKVLSLQIDVINRNKGAWLINLTIKESNFTTLTSTQQTEIDQQINMMIRAKYNDINYNGLNMRKMNLLTKDNTINPFDNTTVIIDEAHNFVSRIANKIKKTDSISYKLYDYLMRAQNVRIVLLTGTPIINYPNELGILFNILRGYIKTWQFQINVRAAKINRDEILNIFQKNRFNTYDYVEYSGNKLTITRNPFGFVNKMKPIKGG